MIEEIWKDIKEYEGKYQVSNLGKVRSLNYNNTGKSRELKIKVNRLGFCEVKDLNDALKEKTSSMIQTSGYYSRMDYYNSLEENF